MTGSLLNAEGHAESSDTKEAANVIVKTTHSLRRFLPFGGSVGQLSNRTSNTSECSLDENDSNQSSSTPVPASVVGELALTLSGESGTEALRCPQHEARYFLEDGLEHASQGRYEEASESLVQALSLSHGSDLQPRVLWTLVSHHVKRLESDEEEYHRTEADTYLSVLKPYMEDLKDEWIEQEATPALLDFLQEHGQWATALRVARVVQPEDTVSARIHYETATQLTSAEAVPHLLEALYLCDNDESLKASILNTMVTAHSAEKDWSKALWCHGCYMECLDSPLDIAQAHFDAAELYVAQNDFKAALTSLDEASQLVDEDPLAGQILQAKAHILYHQGRPSEALRSYELLLERVKHNPADAAKLYYTMGRICIKTGRYEQALEYFASELEITKAALGKYHMEVSRILHELARIQDEFLSDADAALKLYQAALKVERHAKKRAPPEKKQEIGSQILETQAKIGRIHYKRGGSTHYITYILGA